MAFENGVIERDYFYIQIRLASPLCVSSGESEYTDSDVERDFDGNPFVAGTSLTGAFRSYLLQTEKDKIDDIEKLFGNIKNQTGYQSRFYISDLTFEKGCTIAVRNQTKLKEKVAVTGAKFDMENIEKDTTGCFYIEMEFRKNDSAEFKNTAYFFFKKIIYGIHYGEITFGSNKSNGFGYISIQDIYGRGFGSDMKEHTLLPDACCSDFSEWIAFDKWHMKEETYKLKYEEMIHQVSAEPLYTTIHVPLKLKSNINIRQYITGYGEDDSEHISRTGKDGTKDKKKIPIIPGSSWKGAVRSQCEHILHELNMWDETLINQMFGFIENEKKREHNKNDKDEKKKNSSISSIYIDETDIENGHYLSVTRNQIDRFSGSTVTHALLQESICVHGECKLTIHILKEKKEKVEDKNAWMIGLLMLAIKDLQNGYLSVGGETGIGRGIFAANGGIQIWANGNETPCDEDKIQEYIQKLVDKKEEMTNAT